MRHTIMTVCIAVVIAAGVTPITVASPPLAPKDATPSQVLDYLMDQSIWGNAIMVPDEFWIPHNEAIDRIRSAPDLYAAEIERRVELPATYEEATRLSIDELRKIATTSVNTLWYLRFVGRDFAEPVLRRVHDKASALAEAVWCRLAPLAPPEVQHAPPPGVTAAEWSDRFMRLYEPMNAFQGIVIQCVTIAGELESPIFVDACLRELAQAGEDRFRYQTPWGVYVDYTAKFARQRPDVAPRLMLVKDRWKDNPTRDWQVDDLIQDIDRALERISRSAPGRTGDGG